MSGKLLVVGDSFSTTCYLEDKLSHHLNMKLTNLSKSGIGNKQIFDLNYKGH